MVISAADQDAAAVAAVRWVHDNDLGGAAGIGLVVTVVAVDQPELEDRRNPRGLTVGAVTRRGGCVAAGEGLTIVPGPTYRRALTCDLVRCGGIPKWDTRRIRRGRLDVGGG